MIRSINYIISSSLVKEWLIWYAERKSATTETSKRVTVNSEPETV